MLTAKPEVTITAKCPSQKLGGRTLLLRIQVFKIRKHLCLSLSSIPGWYPPTPSAWSLALGVWETCGRQQHHSVAIEQKDTPGQLLSMPAASTHFPVVCFSRNTAHPLLPLKFEARSQPRIYMLNLVWPPEFNLLRYQPACLTHPAGLEACISPGVLSCTISFTWEVARAAHFSFPLPQASLSSPLDDCDTPCSVSLLVSLQRYLSTPTPTLTWCGFLPL